MCSLLSFLKRKIIKFKYNSFNNYNENVSSISSHRAGENGEGGKNSELATVTVWVYKIKRLSVKAFITVYDVKLHCTFSIIFS